MHYLLVTQSNLTKWIEMLKKCFQGKSILFYNETKMAIKKEKFVYILRSAHNLAGREHSNAVRRMLDEAYEI